MTNLQLYLAVGLPTLLLLLGQWLNFNATKDLRVSVEQRLLVIEADLREFYRVIGKLEGRMDALEHKRS
jgi:hypothetical protein